MEEPFEKRYQYVLLNIESSLLPVYDDHPKMTDHAAIYAIETVIKALNAEAQGRTAVLPQFQPHEKAAYDSVSAICYWLMGQGKMTDENGRELTLKDAPKTLEEIIACLKRIHKSIQFWLKSGGRRGYYEYVSQYLN